MNLIIIYSIVIKRNNPRKEIKNGGKALEKNTFYNFSNCMFV